MLKELLETFLLTTRQQASSVTTGENMHETKNRNLKSENLNHRKRCCTVEGALELGSGILLPLWRFDVGRGVPD